MKLVWLHSAVSQLGICSLPTLPLKRTVFIFWNEWKIYYPIFINSWFCSQFSSVFIDQIWRKKKLSHKIRNILKRIFECMSFFVRFLVLEIWSILYSTVFNNELGIFLNPKIWKKLKPRIIFFANQIPTLTSKVGNSIQKRPGPGGGVPGRGGGGQGPLT